MFRVRIEKGLCIGCGNCVVACPNSASLSARAGHGFGDSNSDIKVVEGIAEFNAPCTGCGICLEVCPTGAVEILAEGEFLQEGIPAENRQEGIPAENRQEGIPAVDSLSEKNKISTKKE